MLKEAIKMKRRMKRSLVLLAAILAVGNAVVATLFLPSITGAPARDDTVSQGRYLVESVAICFECHSERDFSKPGWPIPPGRVGSGRVLWGKGADQVVAPNISPDKVTGIGDWTDDEITRAIREGVGRDGRLLNPEMPYRYFSGLSTAELRSIVKYLRSIPAVSHSLPHMANYVPGNYPPTIAMDSIGLTKSSIVVRRGEYLVRLGGCETCHTPTNEKGFIRGLEFAGGTVFRHDSQADASSNLTPDLSGIGSYHWQRFERVLRTGRDGTRTINSAMPWYFYRNLTDSDLKAIFAYLMALPPVQHKVDNSATPTPCPKCGNVHGLGNQNRVP
jgi:mono/diheme cytochrome c family protein